MGTHAYELSPRIIAALTSIGSFLDRVGLSETTRALKSEVEKRGSRLPGKRAKASAHDPADALDRVLSSALCPNDDGENIDTNNGRHISHGSERIHHQENGSLCGARPQERRTLTSRLRGAEESGMRGKDCRAMEVITDKVRFEHSAPIAILRGHREPLVNLEILPVVNTGSEGGKDGGQQLIFSASLDRTLRLWSIAEGTGECQTVVVAPGGQLSDARVLSRGMHAACCSEDGKTFLMDMTHARCVEEFTLGSHHGQTRVHVSLRAWNRRQRLLLLCCGCFPMYCSILALHLYIRVRHRHRLTGAARNRIGVSERLRRGSYDGRHHRLLSMCGLHIIDPDRSSDKREIHSYLGHSAGQLLANRPVFVCCALSMPTHGAP